MPADWLPHTMHHSIDVLSIFAPIRELAGRFEDTKIASFLVTGLTLAVSLNNLLALVHAA